MRGSESDEKVVEPSQANFVRILSFPTNSHRTGLRHTAKLHLSLSMYILRLKKPSRAGNSGQCTFVAASPPTSSFRVAHIANDCQPERHRHEGCRDPHGLLWVYARPPARLTFATKAHTFSLPPPPHIPADSPTSEAGRTIFNAAQKSSSLISSLS